jgi:hypothetical protein
MSKATLKLFLQGSVIVVNDETSLFMIEHNLTERTIYYLFLIQFIN